AAGAPYPPCAARPPGAALDAPASLLDDIDAFRRHVPEQLGRDGGVARDRAELEHGGAPERVADLHHRRQSVAEPEHDALEPRLLVTRQRLDPLEPVARRELAQ